MSDIQDKNLIYRQETFGIYGAAIEVHRVLGPGFSEAVYQEALEMELAARGIPFDPQREMRVFYKSQLLKKTFIPDFVCYDKIVVEIKALDEITGKEKAQVINYLKVTDFRLGLLINFGSVGKLERCRLINFNSNNSRR